MLLFYENYLWISLRVLMQNKKVFSKYMQLILKLFWLINDKKLYKYNDDCIIQVHAKILKGLVSNYIKFPISIG